ncbi:MAG: HigA family addiction module antidote protein [Sphingomonadales bacterium]|nr:HigA family addiction module antidote protein [Sphingomonadales bacterium]PIX67005.1 MAG: addiction module antidote protein, HigA family [Sphingomonadales bacterium CG_4_10_14_3_um_filter_58_15]NCO49462.1 HigA family addiction module antidote protein [Sphingomonadales bacterium]NCP01307.1 HigA family addiction module antidote protein [Sphingomonadales bacterium]NCP26637.1 HigA family addiction module antidote protein [Sphingomonadales bacterium]
MSGSRTITGDEGRLDNVHPGDILREDYLIGSDIPVSEVAEGAGLDTDHLNAILSGQQPIDANADIRLARYFGISEGFFLGLQIDYDLEEVRRANGPELDKISKRAA